MQQFVVRYVQKLMRTNRYTYTSIGVFGLGYIKHECGVRPMGLLLIFHICSFYAIFVYFSLSLAFALALYISIYLSNCLLKCVFLYELVSRCNSNDEGFFFYMNNKCKFQTISIHTCWTNRTQEWNQYAYIMYSANTKKGVCIAVNERKIEFLETIKREIKRKLHDFKRQTHWHTIFM